MCNSIKVIGGPSTAKLLRAIEWSGSPGQPMLYFKLAAGNLIESMTYRVHLITNDLFVVSVITTHGDELEIIWEPAKQHGRCIQLLASV